MEDVFDKEIDIHVTADDDDENQGMSRGSVESLSHTGIKLYRTRSGVFSVRSSISWVSNDYLKVQNEPNTRPNISCLKLGNTEYRTGRIEYKVPTALRLSRANSIRSNCSFISNEQPTTNNNDPDDIDNNIRIRFFVNKTDTDLTNSPSENKHANVEKSLLNNVPEDEASYLGLRSQSSKLTLDEHVDFKLE